MKEPCCNNRIRKYIKDNSPEITNVYFDLSNICRLDGKGVTKTGQKIEIWYDKKMKSGEVRNIKRNTFVSHLYCPFCGKKYN